MNIQNQIIQYEYRVVPFVGAVPNENVKEGNLIACSQLETLIVSWAEQKWEYVRLESVDTYIAGNKGCFVVPEPGRMTSYSMVVFRRCRQ